MGGGRLPRIDVLVIITQEALNERGGLAPARLTALRAIANANTAFASSKIPAILNLVGLVPTTGAFKEPAGRFAFGQMLDQLISGKIEVEVPGGAAVSVQDMRNKAGADLVSMFVLSREGAGLAETMYERKPAFEKRAYSVVYVRAAAGRDYYSFTHELGHNFGCCHDRANHAGPTPIETYAHGYSWKVGDAGVRTIMCVHHPRILAFSNPGVPFNGHPTGVPIGKPNEAHNAKVIADSAPLIATFR